MAATASAAPSTAAAEIAFAGAAEGRGAGAAQREHGRSVSRMRGDQNHGCVPGSAHIHQRVRRAQAASRANVSAKYPPRSGASTLGNHMPTPRSTGYSILSSTYGTGCRPPPRSSWSARMSEYESAANDQSRYPQGDGCRVPSAVRTYAAARISAHTTD